MKQHELVNLELGIRALEHEKLVSGLTNAATQWQAGYDTGYRAGLEHAIQTLRNLNAANQQSGEDARP